MTKREAAERNVKNNYNVDCKECPLADMCAETYGKDRTYADCSDFCKQYLADNPVDDWQELDEKEFEIEHTERYTKDGNGNISDKRAVILYRPRQPEKTAPSHEEIMTKWWKCTDGSWKKVTVFYIDNGTALYRINGEVGSLLKGWFITKVSATIPPEAE